MSESPETSGPALETEAPTAAQPAALRSVFTDGLPAILDHFGISLHVSTCQAGRVIPAHSDDGSNGRTTDASGEALRDMPTELKNPILTTQ